MAAMTDAGHVQIRPFRAVRHDPRRVDLQDVVAPPYDVIDDELKARLEAMSPYNMVRLILPEPGDEASARAALDEWRSTGVLATDPRPAYYRVEQVYVGPDGVERTRQNLIALVRLARYDEGVVLPHERTKTGPKEGRLRLLAATEAQLSPVFALFHDPDGVVDRRLRASSGPAPEVDVVGTDGTRTRMWRIVDHLDEVTHAVGRSRLLIADGHHRYETALAHAETSGANGDDPRGWTLMQLAAVEGEGLTIFPTHRVVSGVDEATRSGLAVALADEGFSVSRLSGRSPEAIEAALAAAEGVAMVIVAAGEEPLLAELADPAARLPEVAAPLLAIDAVVAGELVVGRVLGIPPDAVATTDRLVYLHRVDEAVSAVDALGDAVAILLRAPSIAQVEAVAEAGAVMPQKSTYFFPKTLDGLAIYTFDRV
jgi:uncharacterized protein (DUF1015 family)